MTVLREFHPSLPRKPREGSLSTTTCHRGNCGRSYGPVVAIAPGATGRIGLRYVSELGNKCRKKREPKPVMTPGRGGECRHAWSIRRREGSGGSPGEKKIRRHGSFREPPVVEMIRDVRILIVTSLTYWILFRPGEEM